MIANGRPEATAADGHLFRFANRNAEAAPSPDDRAASAHEQQRRRCCSNSIKGGGFGGLNRVRKPARIGVEQQPAQRSRGALDPLDPANVEGLDLMSRDFLDRQGGDRRIWRGRGASVLGWPVEDMVASV